MAFDGLKKDAWSMVYRGLPKALLALGAALLLVPGALAQQKPAIDQSSPLKVAEAIVAACREGRFDEIEGYMHPVMRYRWSELGIVPKQMCDGITRGGTLRTVEVALEPSLRDNEYTPVLLTYTYGDGTKASDRMLFFNERGTWKLIG